VLRPEVTSAPTGKPQVYVPAKNPGVAVLMSFFLPGAGSLYAGSTAAGVVLLICWFVSWLFMLAAIPAFLIVWILGMATAYGAAVKFNQRNGVNVH
jgi:TM2 domain-containing membrane protein YozV